jgi:hypothetical protein
MGLLGLVRFLPVYEVYIQGTRMEIGIWDAFPAKLQYKCTSLEILPQHFLYLILLTFINNGTYFVDHRCYTTKPIFSHCGMIPKTGKEWARRYQNGKTRGFKKSRNIVSSERLTK